MKDLLLQLLSTMGLMSVDLTNFAITGSPVKKGEEVLGEMNDLEKTCFAFLELQQNNHKELHKKMDAVEEGSPEFLELQTQHCLLKESTKIASGLMWGSIHSRFPNANGFNGVGVRDGNQVVRTPKTDEDQEDGFPFGLGAHMMIIGIGNRG